MNFKEYILSIPSCTAIKSAFETLTNVHYQTSDQHKALSTTRVTRNYTDAVKVLGYLMERNPFDKKHDSVNIEVAAENMNFLMPSRLEK